ncbi:MAG: prolyl oligopeptidase family serine peptidase, partial [Nitriliruptoraceae bacterium]
AAQNQVTETHLAALPARAPFRSRLRELWDQPRQGAPWRRGGWWFQLRNNGREDQDVLWSAPASPAAPSSVPPPSAAWSVLVDPNGWSEDGTASLTGLAVSDDGARLAVGRSDAGSDWVIWRVVEVADGRLHPDTVTWSKFAPAAWLPDGSGFLYGAYDPPPPGQEHAAAVRDQRLRLHRLGDDQADDQLVHARPDQPEWSFHPSISHDGRWLVLTIHRGTDPTSRVHVAELYDGEIGEIRPLLDDGEAEWTPLGVLGRELVLLTDDAAPRGRVVAVDLDAPDERRELVAEGPDQLDDVRLVGAADDQVPGWLVCRRLHHAVTRLDVHDPRSGVHRFALHLDGPVSVTDLGGGRYDDAVHAAVESLTRPVEVVRFDLAGAEPRTGGAGAATPGAAVTRAAVTGERVQLAGTPTTAPTDTACEPVVEQVRVHHDGVAVPLFLVHRADVVPDGHRPTVLWGYGGFGIPVTPMYRPAWRAWVDAGGVLAVACLRGGGEYGRAWHDDGRLANKQHVFDDALACAAWLCGDRRDAIRASALTAGTDVDAVWSSSDHLGVEGRSNGGLLVGACLTQAPQRFASAVPEVGVLDLTRFHRFTIGWAWTSDYGDPDDPDDLAVLLRYSPYHRLVPGTRYPATLLTTGDTDDRVVPAHSFKFAAALQHAQGGDAPVLLRIDTSAGHGLGKPVSKQIEERADVLAFHAAHLGLEVTDEGTA